MKEGADLHRLSSPKGKVLWAASETSFFIGWLLLVRWFATGSLTL